MSKKHKKKPRAVGPRAHNRTEAQQRKRLREATKANRLRSKQQQQQQGQQQGQQQVQWQQKENTKQQGPPTKTCPTRGGVETTAAGKEAEKTRHAPEEASASASASAFASIFVPGIATPKNESAC